MIKSTVILSERGPGRTLQPGGGESKNLRLLFAIYDKNFCLTTLDTSLYAALKGRSALSSID